MCPAKVKGIEFAFDGLEAKAELACDVRRTFFSGLAQERQDQFPPAHLSLDLKRARLILLPTRVPFAGDRSVLISVLRNPNIAHVLYLRGLMEKASRGSVLMVQQCRDAGLPDPFRNGHRSRRSILQALTGANPLEGAVGLRQCIPDASVVRRLGACMLGPFQALRF